MICVLVGRRRIHLDNVVVRSEQREFYLWGRSRRKEREGKKPSSSNAAYVARRIEAIVSIFKPNLWPLPQGRSSRRCDQVKILSLFFAPPSRRFPKKLNLRSLPSRSRPTRRAFKRREERGDGGNPLFFGFCPLPSRTQTRSGGWLVVASLLHLQYMLNRYKGSMPF